MSLGAKDPRLLFVLGSLDLAARRVEAGIDRMAIAAASNPESQDGALSPIVYVALGEALQGLGYLHAGNEAIERGIAHSERISKRSIYEGELARLYPRRGRLMRVVGDQWLRLDEPAQAAVAYAAAWRLGSPVTDAVVPKHVFAFVLDGRSDLAAGRLADAFEESSTRLDDRLIEAIEILDDSSRGELGDQLGRMLDDESIDRTTRGWLTRARARTLDDDEERELLRQWLGQSPLDRLALFDLLATHDDDNRLGEELLLLAEVNPVLALEGGRLVALRGKFGEGALDSLEVLADPGDASVPIARVALLLGMGRASEALDVLTGLDDSEDELANLLAAVALHDMGRLDLAVARSKRAQAAGLQRDLLASAWLHQRMQRPMRAVMSIVLMELFEHDYSELDANSMWLRAARREILDKHGPETARRVLELDPSNVDAINVLIRAAPAENGSLLRDLVGGSRLRRLLAAEQMFGAGDRNEAERALTMLALGGNESDRAIDLLMSLWLSARGLESEIAIDRGIAVLDQLQRERGGDAALVIAQGRLLEASGRREQAIETLTSSLENPTMRRSPMRRELEDMMLRDVGMASQGRELRDARLAQPDLTIGERVERAAELVGSKEVYRAVRILRAGRWMAYR